MMGDIVAFRQPDPTRVAYEAEVRELCALAHLPDERADVYIRRGTPRDVVMSDCILAVFGRRLPQDGARHMARLTGPAGSRRRQLPKNFSQYGAPRQS